MSSHWSQGFIGIQEANVKTIDHLDKLDVIDTSQIGSIGYLDVIDTSQIDS